MGEAIDVAYRRPLHATVNSLLDGGFRLDRMAEPMPVRRCARVDPRACAVPIGAPLFRYIRATADGWDRRSRTRP